MQRFLAMGIISEESLLEKNWGSIIELKRLINNKHPKLTRLPADHDTQVRDVVRSLAESSCRVCRVWLLISGHGHAIAAM